MIPIRFRTNFAELQTWLGQLATKQVPFATAKALTRTALDSRDAVRAELPKRFKIKSPWTARGIRAVPAFKRDWPRCVAYVGSVDPWMELQETGGTKRPKKGAKNVAIPTKATERRRRSGGRLPKSVKPAALIASGKAFTRPRARTGAHAGEGKVLHIRRGRKGEFLDVRFLLQPTVRVRPAFGFRDTVEDTVARVYPARFREAFEAAITAPKRPGRLK